MYFERSSLILHVIDELAKVYVPAHAASVGISDFFGATVAILDQIIL